MSAGDMPLAADLDSNDDMFGGMFTVRSEDDAVFYFTNLEIDCLSGERKCNVTFHYSYRKEYYFTSAVVIEDDDGSFYQKLSTAQCIMSLFSIGMTVLPWFWMGFATKSIIIDKPICSKVNITTDVVSFWQSFYDNILVEFAYENALKEFKITLGAAQMQGDDHISLTSNETYPPNIDRYPAYAIPKCSFGTSHKYPTTPQILVPLGGGKDSLVVWYQAQQSTMLQCRDGNTLVNTEPLGNNVMLMYVGDGLDEFSSSWRLQAIKDRIGSPTQLVAHVFQDGLNNFQGCRFRSLSKQCGHPWAALVYFDAVLVCQLRDIPMAWMGFEKSAAEGNGVYVNGIEVNHQYDKSPSFTARAASYVRKHINQAVRLSSPIDSQDTSKIDNTKTTVRDVTVVSTLENMWEIEIARIFCEETALLPFHPLFLSCNEPVLGTQWCGCCDKCAFIFLLLSAWLRPAEVVQIFGGVNMFTNEKLVHLFLSLLGANNGKKPFDCVGTVFEACAAAQLAAVRYYQPRWESSSSSTSVTVCSSVDQNKDKTPMDDKSTAASPNEPGDSVCTRDKLIERYKNVAATTEIAHTNSVASCQDSKSAEPPDGVPVLPIVLQAMLSYIHANVTDANGCGYTSTMVDNSISEWGYTSSRVSNTADSNSALNTINVILRRWGF